MEGYYVWRPGICEGDRNTASWYWNSLPENTVPSLIPISSDIYKQIDLLQEKSSIFKV